MRAFLTIAHMAGAVMCLAIIIMAMCGMLRQPMLCKALAYIGFFTNTIAICAEAQKHRSEEK